MSSENKKLLDFIEVRIASLGVVMVWGNRLINREVYSQLDGALVLKFDCVDIVFVQSSWKKINNQLKLLGTCSVKNI